MRSELLDAQEAAELRATPFSYPEVGATRGDLPAGYTPLRREVHIGAGQEFFDLARTALFGWHVHRAAGPKVVSSSLLVADDTVAVVRIGVGPLALKAPVKIVYVVDEPGRAGFAYGTLPGHPEQGEESFMISMDEAGRVRFDIVAFSKPATRLAQTSGSLGRAMQNRVTERYIDAMIQYTRPDTHPAR
ncbi:MAG TPA: DUF1990 domain-containing protein [Microlunatus sp.]|nr:DUF1990 domain-containing protein [Microlunatus sp.]